jgi:serine/threonine-protein phosphatase PP1 catalytic subunit
MYMYTCVTFVRLHNFNATGLSPDLQSMEQIRRIMRPTDVPDQGRVLVHTCTIWNGEWKVKQAY